MWLWTLPSENSPRKCSVERLATALAITSVQPRPVNISPLLIAACTSLAPWSKTRPAPKALWPTSELPMSASEGMPTAVPCAASRVHGHEAISPSSTGFFAAATASPG